MSSQNSLKFWKHLPKASYFLLWNEFCERFTWYGLVSILPMFFTAFLGLPQKSAVEIMHGMSFASYIFAFIGSAISDVALGKFKTILIFSCIYALGVVALTLSAVPAISAVWMTGISLLILTIGTGGIKPCVSAFGGDQIDEPTSRSVFFSYFYLMVNVGSFISMFVTPLIKSQHCLGREDCFAMAFGLPAILMSIAVLLFVAGKRHYRPPLPPNDSLLQSIKACGSALLVKAKLSILRIPHESPQSFVYYASEKYSSKVLEDARIMISVLIVYMPLCLYWGLYSQMSTRWIFQAGSMNGRLFGGRFTIMPEQMGIINCILVLILVPLFDAAIYPLIRRCRGGKAPSYTSKIMASMLIGSIAFVITALLQWVIEAKGTFEPNPLNPAIPKCVDGCVPILWQFPQYLVLTISEVLISVATINLGYSMAPDHLKSVCGALSMVTNAIGNLLVMGFTKWDPIKLVTGKDIPSAVYLMWSGLCMIGLGLFYCSSRQYRDLGHHEMAFIVVVDNEPPKAMEEVSSVEVKKDVV